MAADGGDESGMGAKAVEGLLQKALTETESKLQQCLAALRQAGCRAGPDYFKVIPCGALRTVGGYSQSEGIILCHDQLQTPSQVKSTALHELLHAYDDCRAGPKGLDWADCRAHACAEVRAASLSGDCDLGEEVWRGNVEVTKPSTWFNVHARCVARRAALSVQLNPNCQGEGVAVHAVADVMARCMADRMPFHSGTQGPPGQSTPPGSRGCQGSDGNGLQGSSDSRTGAGGS